jgi:hypothetical protein
MVTAFLSGSTNPPPKNWFFRCETWTGACARDGSSLTVPEGAQQVLVFLAPATSGDFRTLVNAVRGRPGVFVRTSQDLDQAALDRSRLDAYFAAIRHLSDDDPAKLKESAPLLARSLAIKVDEKCLGKAPELQIACLMQGHESLILNDGHSTSIVEALTSGPASDLAMEASFTPQLGYGYYSPYVAAVLDVARLLDPFRTAQYQYIPALGAQHGAKIDLTLNAAPSFYDPKSVLVAALPAVEKAQLPPLHAIDPKEIYCARKAALVLPVEGAPLVFSTAYARDASLRLAGSDGKTIDLPAKADAAEGGYVVDTAGLPAAGLGASIEGALHAAWGFDAYEGPRFKLVNSRAQGWRAPDGDQTALIVGRAETVHLQANDVSCIDSIMLKDAAGKDLKVEWKPVRANELELRLPLENAKPGDVTLLVKQYGGGDAEPVQLRAFSEASHLEGFSIRAGDSQGLLTGNRLDEVASLSIKGVSFVPSTLSSRAGHDELMMSATDPEAASALKKDNAVSAKVTLADGRSFGLTATIDGARPSARLLRKSVQASASSSGSNIQLADQEEIPEDATLVFSVRSQTPAVFAREETIEVATQDESSTTTLGLANGGVTLEDAHVAVATLNPEKAFGFSAFGPLKFRVAVGGVAGEWMPLATLVRLPTLKSLECPASAELACKLTGSNLFLIDAISVDPKFSDPVHVPDGFPGAALPVPHPDGGSLFVRLRDDPGIVNPTTLVAAPLSSSTDDAARAESRRAAVPDGAVAKSDPL